MSCVVCGGSGTVGMKDCHGYVFTFACRCSNGRLPKNDKFMPWNGEASQQYNGQTMTYLFPEELSEKPRITPKPAPLPVRDYHEPEEHDAIEPF